MTLGAAGGGQQTVPMSAARLAAEAAFAASPFDPAPPSQAQVTVRKSRLAVGSLAVAMPPATATATNNSPSALTSKGSRVFRVDASGSAPSGPAPVARPAGPTGADGPSIDVSARTRRIAIDKRPGPVLHVIHALPARSREIQAVPPTLETLIAELARVESVLESIHRAQTFTVIDDRYADEWQRLSQRAEEICKGLQAQRR